MSLYRPGRTRNEQRPLYHSDYWQTYEELRLFSLIPVRYFQIRSLYTKNITYRDNPVYDEWFSNWMTVPIDNEDEDIRDPLNIWNTFRKYLNKEIQAAKNEIKMANRDLMRDPHKRRRYFDESALTPLINRKDYLYRKMRRFIKLYEHVLRPEYTQSKRVNDFGVVTRTRETIWQVKDAIKRVNLYLYAFYNDELLNKDIFEDPNPFLLYDDEE